MKIVLMMNILMTGCLVMITDVQGNERGKRESPEKADDEQVSCPGSSPGGHMELGHTFKDMPMLFEHVMGLLQREPAVLEQSYSSELGEVEPVGRDARSAPTPENLERLLDQFEARIARSDKNRSRLLKYKRDHKTGPTQNGYSKNKRINKRNYKDRENNENEASKIAIKKRKSINAYNKVKKDKLKTNTKRELNGVASEVGSRNMNEAGNRNMNQVIKRSNDEEDVGDADKDFVKEHETADSGASDGGGSHTGGQTRAESGGGGQQMVMGTFQAMIMPMPGAAQVIGGIMPSG